MNNDFLNYTKNQENPLIFFIFIEVEYNMHIKVDRLCLDNLKGHFIYGNLNLKLNLYSYSYVTL